MQHMHFRELRLARLAPISHSLRLYYEVGRTALALQRSTCARFTLTRSITIVAIVYGISPVRLSYKRPMNRLKRSIAQCTG